MFEKVSILKPVLDAALNARPAAKWPAYDDGLLPREQFVSASEIGKCLRMIWFGKNVPLEQGNYMDGNWGFAERGHSHEQWIVEQLRSYEHEYDWTYIGKDQVSFYDGNQSGTPDGLLNCEHGLLVVDFKSIDPRKNRNKLPVPENVDQIIQNIDLMEVCLDVDIDGGLLAYSDASNYADIIEYKINRSNPKVGERMIELENRAETVMTATSADQLPPEGIYSGGCTYCNHKALCSATVEQTRQMREKHDKATDTAKRIFG